VGFVAFVVSVPAYDEMPAAHDEEQDEIEMSKSSFIF